MTKRAFSGETYVDIEIKTLCYEFESLLSVLHR